ncbi:hypothetical protein HanRHA438_Chr15g0706061 [Helianthus annuus]|nr:hypothetical protein HanRHA438_Chr15g0706061 [Helianthus annuus]
MPKWKVYVDSEVIFLELSRPNRITKSNDGFLPIIPKPSFDAAANHQYHQAVPHTIEHLQHIRECDGRRMRKGLDNWMTGIRR